MDRERLASDSSERKVHNAVEAAPQGWLRNGCSFMT